MQVWITSPRVKGPLFDRLWSCWTSLFPGDNLHLRIANSYEIHGDLLNRIYQEIVDHPDPQHVISEIDFLPYPTFKETADSVFRGGSPVALTPYVTRTSELQLINHWPLVGAWLLLLDKSRFLKPPALTWLEASSVFNDAANHALHNLVAAGSIEDENDLTELLYYDNAPDSLGLEYSGLGYHAFFARHFNDPPSRDLFPGFTLAQHLADINARLTALGA